MSKAGQGRDGASYWWGRFFVRSATVLAAILLVATAIAVVIEVIWMRRSLTEAAYQPSAELAEEIESLTTSCRQTQDLLITHFGDSVAPEQGWARFPESLADEADLIEATEALEAYDGAIQSMKEGMVTRFAEAADWLLASMDRKAEQIRDRIEQEHSAEARDLQFRIQALRNQLEDGGRGLYGRLSPAEIRSREQVLDQAAEFFDYLGELTKSRAVQSHIDAAVGSLGRMKEMLPEPASESYRLSVVSKVAQLRRRLDALLKQGHKLEGEELAERLSQLKSDVIQAVHMSWAVEDDLSRLRERIEAEAEQADNARSARRDVLRQGLVRIVLTLGGGLLVSFVLVVIADVFRALFDTASWVGRLAHARGVDDPASGGGSSFDLHAER